MKSKKPLKLILGVIVFFTLPSLLFFGFMYLKYDEELPVGISGEQADALARNMLEALNYKAFEETEYIEWTYKNRRHYEWHKSEKTCDVFWEEYKVTLDLTDYSQSKAYLHSFIMDNDIKDGIIKKAIKYFHNDSFWLVAPYKVFDEGTKRQLVKLPDGKDALLVTYTSGGNTPGDSYLWHFDDTGKPKCFQMWTSILPIDGLEASWADWITTETGAQLPTFHRFLFMGLQNSDIKTQK